MPLRSHADAWLAAWNASDRDAIIACYSEDVDFAAPTVIKRWGRDDGRLQGRAELRRHFKLGLELAPRPDLHGGGIPGRPGRVRAAVQTGERQPGARRGRTEPGRRSGKGPRFLREPAAITNDPARCRPGNIA